MAEIKRDYAEIEKCVAIKITGLNKLYSIACKIPHSDISTQEFYGFLQICVHYTPAEEPDSMRAREKLFQTLSSGGDIKTLFNLNQRNVFNDFHDFFMAGIRSHKLAFEDINKLYASSPYVQQAMKRNPRSGEQNELQKMLGDLGDTLSTVTSIGVEYSKAMSKFLDSVPGMGKK